MTKQNKKGEKKQPKNDWIIFLTWKESQAYRESESLACAGDSNVKTISGGDLYTRHKASYYGSVHAFCRNGVPFVDAERTSRALYHKYQRGQADGKGWREHYRSGPIFGPDIHIIKDQEV